MVSADEYVPEPLGAAQRLRLLTYASVPTFLLNFAAPYLGLIGLPITFFLKNRLHLTAHDTATFNLIVCTPLFVGFVFGFIRDRWSPFGRRDRGHMALFGLITAGLYVGVALLPPTYPVLLVGGLLLTASIQFVWSAAGGLASAVGQHHAMTGQMSTALNLANLIPICLSMLLGGVLAGALEGGGAVAAARSIFLLGAALMVAVAAFGAFGPRQLFEDIPPLPNTGVSLFGDIGRLLRHRSIYPALIVQLLWQFAPGAGTALQFHLANNLHATDAQVGAFFAIFYGSFVPVMALYGWLSRRVRLSRLLWWGGVIAVPQMIALLFIHTPQAAMLAAVTIGMLGGIAQGAYTDLALRSCPKGLEGTMMMLWWSMYWIAVRFGDLWGTDLYDKHGGYNATLLATIAVYACILPVLFLVPKSVGDTIDA